MLWSSSIHHQALHQSVYWLLFVKNHNLSLTLDNQTVKLLSIQSINWINSVYSHKHVEYNNADFYSTIVSTLIILQHQLSLSSQACQLFSSISLSSHAQFSWLNFLWLKFSHSFLCYFFVQLISFLHLRFWLNLLSQTVILLCVMLLLRNLSFALFLIMFCLFVWDFSQVYLYKLLFNLMQHFQKDFLFVLLNI